MTVYITPFASDLAPSDSLEQGFRGWSHGVWLCKNTHGATTSRVLLELCLKQDIPTGEHGSNWREGRVCACSALCVLLSKKSAYIFRGCISIRGKVCVFFKISWMKSVTNFKKARLQSTV